RNLKVIEFPEAEAPGSSGCLWMFNSAPNPNAAKVFANWILTKEGQTAWANGSKENSRRMDVPLQEPDLLVKPGPNYLNGMREPAANATEDMRKLVDSLLK